MDALEFLKYLHKTTYLSERLALSFITLSSIRSDLYPQKWLGAIDKCEQAIEEWNNYVSKYPKYPKTKTRLYGDDLAMTLTNAKKVLLNGTVFAKEMAIEMILEKISGKK